MGHMCQVMGHMSGLCHLRLCCIRGYVIWDYVAFRIMLFGIMSHLGLFLIWGFCCIQYSIVCDYVIWVYVVRDYVVLLSILSVYLFS